MTQVATAMNIGSSMPGEGWRNYQNGKSRQERGYGRPWEVRRARILQLKINTSASRAYALA